MSPRPIPIGIDDFREVREACLEYVDKSDLIRRLLDRSGVKVLLFPRPRRFGKTLNLSMLRCWFEKQDTDLSRLFEGLSIWQAGDEYRAHFQRYPVIHFNFKGSKGASLAHAMGVIQKKIRALFREHAYLLESDRLQEWETRDFRAVLEDTADPTLYEGALLDLSGYLHAHHSEKVVILIDEYDEPIHAGHVHGYATEILDFMRNFLGEGLKSNPHLYKAVVTGILRVAKETSRTTSAPLRTPLRNAELRLRGPDSVLPMAPSENLFSGLNNLDVYTLLARPFNTCFGFTEDEVVALVERHGRGSKMADLRRWYNGYVFGGEIIYNPWSLCNYLQRGEETPAAFWVSTSSNDLVRELLELHAFDLQPVFESLLAGGSVDVALDENVALGEIRRSQGALWSLLVFAGYLKAEAAAPALDAQSTPMFRLSIPNLEVRGVYSTTFRGWMEQRMETSGGSVAALTRALLEGDAETFEEELQAFVTNVLSYHDPGKLRPERVYQGFLVGLLAVLEPGHQVRSNRESGRGRADVMIRPTTPGKPGVVLELKVARPGKKTLDQALAEGLAQMDVQGYAAELVAAGAMPVHRFAVAFDGKVVRVQSAPG